MKKKWIHRDVIILHNAVHEEFQKLRPRHVTPRCENLSQRGVKSRGIQGMGEVSHRSVKIPEEHGVSADCGVTYFADRGVKLREL